jgi:hypothetical protein
MHVPSKNLSGQNSTLGVRAELAAINWAVVTGTSNQPVLHAYGTETAPTTYSEAESLAWIRQRTLYIIETYGPGRMGVRYSERNARGANKDSAKSRCRVEGVVLEVGSSRNLNIVAGALNTFAKHSGSISTKEELKSDDLRGLDWAKFKDTKLREAILVAAALLPAR